VVKTSGSEHEPRTDTGDWADSFQDVGFSWAAETPDEHSASTSAPAEAPRESPAATPDDKPTEAPPPITRRMRRARRTRRRIVIAAAVAAVFLVFGAVAAVALVRRDNGSASQAPTAVSSERTTVPTTVPPTAAPTTVAPTTVAPTTVAPTTVPPTAASAPGAFTVHATCGGRDCTVAIHQGPMTSAAPAGSLRNGATVQVSCSTHGEVVTDRDTGQRSDVWNRLADGRGYASGLYLQGPAVPSCG
jgi:hypothetical protein